MPKKLQLIRNRELASSFDEARTLLLSIDASSMSDGELITCAYRDTDNTLGVLHGQVVNGAIAIVNDVDAEPTSGSNRPVSSGSIADMVTTISQNYVTTNMLTSGLGGKLDKTGKAASATKADTLATARTIGVGTAVTSSAQSFNGSKNITIPINSVKEAYFAWGGQDLKDPSPMDAVLASELGANRFAFLNTAGVTIEQSTDGGSTWTASTYTDAQKKLLFGSLNKSNTISTPTGTTGQLRITIKAYTNGAANSNLLTGLRKFIVYFVRVPSLTGCKLILEGAKYNGSFAKIKEMEIYAWPGFNVLNLDSNLSFGAFSPSSSSYESLRFTFTNNHATNNIVVGNILAFGGSGNVVPSTMATNGHLYAYDADGNATFPAYVKATSFPQSSDIKLKENIHEVTDDDAAKANQVKIKEYTLIEDETKTKRYGVIAQELESLGLNHLVVDGEVKAVDYISLLCLKIKALESRIAQLEQKGEER